MQNKIKINIAVDVVRALSDKSLTDSIYMMNDSPFHCDNQGTKDLCTSCKPGHIIQWSVIPIDLQTPVVIKNISFLNNHLHGKSQSGQVIIENTTADENLNLKTWTGIVPSYPYMEAGKKVFYILTLQMGNGKNSILSINTGSLIWKL